MFDNKYNIYYTCLNSGVSAEDAIEKLAKLPKISQEKAKRVIHSTNRIIKSGLSRKDADRYYLILDKIGLSVEVLNKSEKIISSISVRETDNNVIDKKNNTEENKKLTWHEHLACGWPLALVGIGGAIGGLCGGAAYAINAKIFGKNLSKSKKYIYSIAVGIGAIAVYFLAIVILAIIFPNLFSE